MENIIKIMYKGNTLDKELFHSIPRINNHLKLRNEDSQNIGVSSNYKLVHKLMNKVIGEKKLTE